MKTTAARTLTGMAALGLIVAGVASFLPPRNADAQQMRAIDYVNATSGNVAAATATATLPATGNRTQYFTGFEITYGGGSAPVCVVATLTGLVGGTENFTVCAPGTATGGGVPIIVQQTTPLPANYNAAISLSVPAIAGGTNMTVNLHGFVLQQ